MSLHQVNVLVTGHTFVTQGAHLMGFLNRSMLEEKKKEERAEITDSFTTIHLLLYVL